MGETEQHFVAVVRESRYLVAAILLALLWTAESVVPMFVGRKHRVPHIATNLLLAAINAAVSYGFAFGIFAATEFARVRGFGVVRWIPLPTWGQWVLAILLFDCWQYWWHRINHRVPLFWRFHAVHHSDAEMDASSGVRFHTGEITLSFLARLVVLPIIGMTIPQVLVYEALSLPIILFHHSNVRLSGRVDRSLRWLIVTPWMHYVHHSRLQPETDSNYSSFLSIWDRLFGSFRLRAKPREIELGLDNWNEREWRWLPGMLLAPFRKRYSRGPAEGAAPSDGGGTKER